MLKISARIMRIIGFCKRVAALIVLLMWRLSFTSAQPGFLSIDCGGKSNRTDPETNITWVTDDNYIQDSGIKVDINNSTSPFYLQSARVFPNPINKSCFEIPLISNIPHLLRIRFNAGNPAICPKLEWKTSLKIALDAAQGLEYLQVGCTPKIIHRDVKTANILLDANFNGKLADFGLSRVAMDDDASHIFTGVRGTAGYLDPKYFSTHMLTDKSDVYSFGVVLLEIIYGRKPVDFKQSEDKIELVKWVTPHFQQVKDSVEVLKIVDNELLEDDNMKSIISVIKLAMKCIVEETSCRPSISEVVMEIKKAIKYENENTESKLDVSEEIVIQYCDLQSRYLPCTDSNESSSNWCSKREQKSLDDEEERN